MVYCVIKDFSQLTSTLRHPEAKYGIVLHGCDPPVLVGDIVHCLGAPNPSAELMQVLSRSGTKYYKSMLDFVIVPLAGRVHFHTATYWQSKNLTALQLLRLVRRFREDMKSCLQCDVAGRTHDCSLRQTPSDVCTRCASVPEKRCQALYPDGFMADMEAIQVAAWKRAGLGGESEQDQCDADSSSDEKVADHEENTDLFIETPVHGVYHMGKCIRRVPKKQSITDFRDRCSDSDLRAIYFSPTAWGEAMGKVMYKNILDRCDTQDDHLTYHYSLIGPTLPDEGLSDLWPEQWFPESAEAKLQPDRADFFPHSSGRYACWIFADHRRSQPSPVACSANYNCPYGTPGRRWIRRNCSRTRCRSQRAV
jgi:hypothetical protein